MANRSKSAGLPRTFIYTQPVSDDTWYASPGSWSRDGLAPGVVSWSPLMISPLCVLALLLRYHSTNGELVP